MNPFALQDEARRNTGRLVALAVLAIAAVVIAAAVVFVCGAWAVMSFAVEKRVLPLAEFFMSVPIVGISLIASLLVVLFGFLWKADDLATPENLMEQVGAQRVFRNRTTGSDAASLARLRLFNVCEEMSIASGVPMPSVWVLEKSSDVNAFVAGMSGDNSALCVTAGALRFLGRDELQGVVAHEFSHILNGDMRLNFRLLLLVAGVTAYNRLGKIMLGRFGSRKDADGRSHGGIRLPRGGRGGRGGGGLAVILLVYIGTALLLWLIGAVGVFFARLLQCAVSRQREFLADASAAQFTRNPEALADALRLTYLAGESQHSSPFDAWRDDVAHMLFAEGDQRFFATHPPVRDRISRLSPRGISADAGLKERIKRIRAERKAASEAREREWAASAMSARAAGGASAAFTRVAVASNNEPDLRLPPEFVARMRKPGGAGAVLVELLRGKLPEGLGAEPTRTQKRRLAARCVIEMRDSESEPMRRKWADTLKSIAEEDGQIDSFEFMLLASARRNLEPQHEVHTIPAARLVGTASRVIATVASIGGDPNAGYRSAESKLSLIPTPLPPMPPPYGDSAEFLDALTALEAMPPLAKREFLVALSAVVAQDGKVTDEESDYVAAVAAAIGALGWKV